MNMRSTTIALSLASAAVLGLAACGSSVDPPAVVPTSSSAGVPAATSSSSPSMATPSGSAMSQDEDSEPSAEASAEGDSGS